MGGECRGSLKCRGASFVVCCTHKGEGDGKMGRGSDVLISHLVSPVVTRGRGG